MIGIFGQWRTDPGAPADLGAFGARVRNEYLVDAPQGRGGAVGSAAHSKGFPTGRAQAYRTGADVVVTGAIFNVADVAGIPPQVTTAAELIAHLYDNDELEKLRNVNGQFAAAVYDRARHRLMLVTDRIGTTAIHVWRQNGEVAFATQLYVLLGDRRIARKADSDAVAQLFTMQRTIGDITPIAGVKALPAACIAKFDADGERRRSYWQLEWKPGGFNDEEGGSRLAEALRRAVARQSIGKRNGLLLSGGVDSRLVLAASAPGRLSCWTTASFDGNPELALARRVASMLRAEHNRIIVNPVDTLTVHDDTVVDSGGLYPASNPMSAFLPHVGRLCDVVLTGHGLDYTLRGYYLPTRFLKLGGSKTRLPMLQTIAKTPTGREVFEMLRQGPPRSTVHRIVLQNRAHHWWRSQEEGMEEALRPWLQSGVPYNAWDAFILNPVNKHYAFTGMMAARAVADLAIPAFDNDVMEVYLGMTPAMRVSGRVVHAAMRRLSSEVARLPNANTHFRADLDPWLEVAALLARAGLRRVGLAARPSLPSASHSAGSWQNLDVLYREDAGHRHRFSEIRGRLDALTCGVLSSDGLAACIDEHLEGRARHGKLLRQLLTHDAWVRRFDIGAAA